MWHKLLFLIGILVKLKFSSSEDDSDSYDDHEISSEDEEIE